MKQNISNNKIDVSKMTNQFYINEVGRKVKKYHLKNIMHVRPHSLVKHLINKSCLSVCKSVYKTKKFLIFDLFCGPGKVSCDLTTKIRIQADGSPIIATDFCDRLKKNCDGVIFNDKNPLYPITLLQNLKRRYKKRNSIFKNITFYQNDANNIIDEILKYDTEIRKFFILDPYNSGQLQWKTIKKIGTHSVTVKEHAIKYTKRPELFVLLMTYGMSRILREDYAKEYITKTLGTQKWLKLLDRPEYKNKSYLVFRDVFAEQLKKLYKEPNIIEEELQPKPQSFEIRSPHSNSPLYYLFFISSHQEINKEIEKRKPWIEKRANTMMDKLYLLSRGYKVNYSHN